MAGINGQPSNCSTAFYDRYEVSTADTVRLTASIACPDANTAATVQFGNFAIQCVGNPNTPDSPDAVSLQKGGFDAGATIGPWGLYFVDTANPVFDLVAPGYKSKQLVQCHFAKVNASVV